MPARRCSVESYEVSDTWYDPMNPQPQSPRVGKLKAAAIGCGIVLGVVILWSVIIPGLLLAWMMWEARPPSQLEFDAERWRNAPGEELRWRMHEDLLDKGLLKGKTELQTKELLGPDCECGYFADWDLVYNMGPEHGLFAIDSVWLVIVFGPDGTFLRARVVTD
jgi:hypothetical protein